MSDSFLKNQTAPKVPHSFDLQLGLTSECLKKFGLLKKTMLHSAQNKAHINQQKHVLNERKSLIWQLT